jgi:alginate O-acetyltransferase complex protein AlgI
VTIPINFLSPYKSGSIIEFWRRWHISLSTFLRDYLYISLGGNRKGNARRYLNLFITMVLGGLWHGAAWTFVVWGALHGIYLLVNHVWRAHAVRSGRTIPPVLSWLLTFMAVVVAWVFFRSETFGGAMNMFAAMAGDAELKRFFGGMPATHDVNIIAPLVAAAGIALFLPNSIELLERMKLAIAEGRGRLVSGMALGAGFSLGVCLMLMNRASPFLYFQF